MGYVLGFLTLVCLFFAWYLWRLVRVEWIAQKRLPQLKEDPAAFTAYWEKAYKKARLRRPKNAILFLVAVGLFHQKEYVRAMERLRFVRRDDPALDRDAVNALQFILLDRTGRTGEAAAFLKEHAASVEQGKKSLWLGL